MTTEEEARKKRCPLSFGVQEIRNGNGDGIREAGPWNCIASDCMAWRWKLPHDGSCDDDKGYCGLAGAP